MKHALKIILPIILILAIVIGACWFFLIARRDVTESIFVYWGEHFYEAGRYSRAVAFYKAAMRFAPKDAELAIRLADAYKQSGNYTKAEYPCQRHYTDPGFCFPLCRAIRDVCGAGQAA